MRKHLLGLAMTIPLSTGAAHAATVLTFTPGSYNVATPTFPNPLQDTTGTLYITGTGMGIVESINDYKEQVTVQGSGLFAGFDGLATGCDDGTRASCLDVAGRHPRPGRPLRPA